MQTRRLTRVLPCLFGRFVCMSKITEGRAKASSVLPTDCSSSAESCSEGEDCEETEGASQIHHSQVLLRAYLRRRCSSLDRMREQGLVPAVLVDGDKDRRPNDGSTDIFISLDAKPLIALVKLIGKRGFISRVFNMDIYRRPSSSELEQSLQVLPRNLNYGPGKTGILNIQFIRASIDEHLKLGVPLEFVGTHLCPGLKKGGTLKKLAKYVVYNCKATEVPAEIVVDLSVLGIGDRVRVQDLEVDFDCLVSDRTTMVCEIVKNGRTLKARARRLKNESLYKKRAMAKMESSTQAHSLSDDEVDVSDDGEDEVVPYRYQKQRALAKKGIFTKISSAKLVFRESDDDFIRQSKTQVNNAKGKISRLVESGKSQNPFKPRLAGAASSISLRGDVADKETPNNVCDEVIKKNQAFELVESNGYEALSSLAKKRPGQRSKKGSGGKRSKSQEQVGAESEHADGVLPIQDEWLLTSSDSEVDGKALPSAARRKARTPKSWRREDT